MYHGENLLGALSRVREYRLAIGIRSEGDEIGDEIGGGEKLGMDFEPDCPSLPPGTPPL